ncbi:hypothetical protein EHP00_1037 [Ecytonucleospora hepatopenaei]|uniref:Uncharacterized protein n=1 Tax=Ecytonucleospora hepatopenaei TaxID=646526 RepID=A0A1W0E563_9MICR|nr:hypothetical protein EHP00_1037 [Ecytonucleospora hepatopenaei]
MKIKIKKSFPVDTCVDAIVCYKEYIVLGGYDYENNQRRGKLIFLNSKNYEKIYEAITEGTFDLKVEGEYLFALNSKSLLIYQDLEERLKIHFESFFKEECNALALYLEIDEIFCYVSFINGKILFLYKNKIIEKVQNNAESTNMNKNEILKHVFSEGNNCFFVKSYEKQPIWYMKSTGKELFYGDESGNLFSINLKDFKNYKIHMFLSGVINIFFKKPEEKMKNNENDDFILCCTTYDGDVAFFNRNNKNLFQIEHTLKTKGIWRMQRTKVNDRNISICSAIYDGLVIMSDTFRVLVQYKVESIVYGICLHKNTIIFADFYKKQIFVSQMI